MIDPDQVLNVAPANGMHVNRLAGATLGDVLRPGHIDPMLLSNGISPISNPYAPDVPRKTSAQALFSSDGEDDVPETQR
jgi:hypothetical protein